MSTFSGTTTSGIEIGADGYDSPLTITAAGYVSDSEGPPAVSSLSVATVVNAGHIAGLAEEGITAVQLVAGGSVTNQSGGTISGYRGVAAYGSASTVVNAGSIIDGNTNTGQGVYLLFGGSVTNQSGGTISGYRGVAAYGSAITVVNAGSIGGGASVGQAIYLHEGGSVTNQSGGMIGGHTGVKAVNMAGTVVNAGSIGGNSGFGVYLLAGGSVTNQSGGTISGGAGAVEFLADFTNRLVIDPGAVFTGAVNGGNTIGAAAISTLELASGANAGTLSGLGTQYIDFAQVTIDSGASWTLSGANTLAAGATLTSAGTLTDAGSLFNAGAITGTSEGIVLADDGTLTNQSGGTISGNVGVAAYNAPATMVNAGDIAGKSVGTGIYLGAGGSVTNQSGGSISGYRGIVVGGTAIVTVVNAGRIAGSTANGDGVRFGAVGYVANQSGGAISGYRGIDAQGVATVENAGSIGGYAGRRFGFGVDLGAGGLVANQAGGAISGYTAISADGDATVTNAGSIVGGAVGGYGVALGDGGWVTNQAGGSISGYDGILSDGNATVVNAGTIVANTGNGFGVLLTAGGTVTNQSGGVITAGQGVYFEAASTVVNAGTITGNAANGIGVYLYAGSSVTNQSGGTISGGADAVAFGAGQDNLLRADPGAVFIGTVDGGNTFGAPAVSTLELGSGAGTLTGLGSQFINFGSVAFDSGADWFIEGSTAGLAGPISGFATGDTIEVAGITVTGSSFVDGVLTLDEASGSVSLDLAGDFTTNSFEVANVAGGAEVALCFCINTLIDTPTGSRPVQDLIAGDLVLTAGGAVRPISWVGTGAVLATRGRRGAATPVIVRKGALGDNVPYQDLRVTKGHSLLIDNALIPVEFLVNHRSILWDDRAQEVKLYHIELDTHDVLVANGAPAESYRDDGNRWLFQNANAGWDQPAKPPCTPVLTGGPVVDAAWRRLLDRSGGEVRMPLTDDPDLHLVVDGKRLDATTRDGGAYVFCLLAKPDAVRIVSRAVVPQELGLARDQRSLGVALRRIVVRRGARSRTAKAGDARLAIGFHPYESANDFVWTDGDAAVPADLLAEFSGPLEIMMMVVGTTRYIDEGIRQRVAVVS